MSLAYGVEKVLTRIGISPSEFKTKEAVRGVLTKATGANTKGLSFGEVLQQITSSVVTPEAVKNIAVTTGIGANIVNAIVKNASPSVRGAIIETIINEQE